MQADNQLPESERRNYKNVFDAFTRIAKKDGFFGLWRGATSTVIRAVALNLAMLVSYDEVKEKLLHLNSQEKETLSTRVMYK
jgi:solute carrier family 25 oxoglutarate transporter 11